MRFRYLPRLHQWQAVRGPSLHQTNSEENKIWNFTPVPLRDKAAVNVGLGRPPAVEINTAPAKKNVFVKYKFHQYRLNLAFIYV